jgi:hypothetical protein
MKDILFNCFQHEYKGKPEKHLHFPPDKKVTLFLFYPKGVWDEDKLTLSEALERYPVNKYNWLFMEG